MAISRRRVLDMLRKEWKQMFRDPRMKPIVFVSPVIQVLLFGYAVNTDVRNTNTFLIDHDRTAESRLLTSRLTATGYFRIVATGTSPDQMVHALDAGDAVVGIEIPAGFARDLRQGTGAVQVIVDGTDSNTGVVAQGYATRIIGEFARDFVSGTPPPGVDAEVRAWFNPELESRVYNVPGIIGLLLLMMCLLLTALGVVREREIGTLDQLLVTPLTPGELILGKTLPVAAVGLIDLALITSVAVLWFHIPFRGSALILLSASLLFIVAGLSVGLLISSISHTQQEAFMTMFMFLLPSIILSGFFYPISSMPIGFQWLTLANPVRHFLEIVRGVFLKDAPWSLLWHQFVTLAVMAAGGLWFATVRFRRSIL